MKIWGVHKWKCIFCGYYMWMVESNIHEEDLLLQMCGNLKKIRQLGDKLYYDT